MADRAAVTDTHPLIYYADGGKRLGPRAAALFQDAVEGDAVIYVPMAVVMEIAFVGRAGREHFRVPPAEFLATLFQMPGFQPLDLTIEQVLVAADLQFNRDSYDALIVAAAQVLGMPLITRDVDIVASRAVKVIW